MNHLSPFPPPNLFLLSQLTKIKKTEIILVSFLSLVNWYQSFWFLSPKSISASFPTCHLHSSAHYHFSETTLLLPPFLPYSIHYPQCSRAQIWHSCPAWNPLTAPCLQSKIQTPQYSITGSPSPATSGYYSLIFNLPKWKDHANLCFWEWSLMGLKCISYPIYLRQITLLDSGQL